jgi:hypothetical protein
MTGTYCYFEPLNEHLADATDAFIASFAPWDFANHPALTAPYLEEFRPLLKSGGGAEGFPASLAFGHFHADRTAALPQLEEWFARLTKLAELKGGRPVFGCVRTDLRLDWCRHHLPGVHIALRRDPRCRFLSALNQAVKGNTYFLERPWVVLGLNQSDPHLAALSRLVGLPPFEGDEAARVSHYVADAHNVEWDRLYLAAFGLYLLAARQVESAHLELDLDAISLDLRARPRAECAIAALTGLSVAFDDCHITRYDKQLTGRDRQFADLEDRVSSCLEQILP